MATKTSPGFHDPTLLEFRGERPYDEQSPSTLLLPNGTAASYMDRQLGNAMTREVVVLWDAWLSQLRTAAATAKAKASAA